ncbi:MAG: transposase [Pirellula sp.]
MLDTDAMQIVFTTPTELSKLWRMNKELFATVLFDSSKDSLLTLLADPQYLGAQPGLLAALHTWSQTLTAHPHVHFIVTFGGLYLAEYLRGGPIGNSRLVSYEHGQVTFRYLDRRERKTQGTKSHGFRAIAVRRAGASLERVRTEESNDNIASATGELELDERTEAT